MAGMDILNNGARSLTGAVVKAYIIFEDERFERNEVKITEVRGRSAGIPPSFPGAAKLTSVAEKASQKAQTLANAIGELVTSPKKLDSSKKHIFQVEFNPAEMSFEAYGGGKAQKLNFALNGKISMTYEEVKPRILLRVPLIFDDCERTDAFMAEKFGDMMAMGRTVISSVANTVTGDTYSVRPKVEGFIAALRNDNTRKLQFCWADMEYKGILESVDAEYTMFNMEGHPIRANVHLGIMLVDTEVSERNMGDWQDSYRAAFDSDGSSLGSATQNVGNLLNLKL